MRASVLSADAFSMSSVIRRVPSRKDKTVPPTCAATCCGFPCRTFSRAGGGMQCDLRLIQHVLTKLVTQTRHMVLLENVMAFPTIDEGKALATGHCWRRCSSG